ncbi:MAG: 2OG-Fe(II) oxygenase family protein [Ilumatobacteraceae bacterium]
MAGSGLGAELTDNRADYREQIDLASEHPARALDVTPAYLRLDGPNLWLPEDVLPGFRALVEEFAYAAELARTLMELLSVGLGLEADHLEAVFGERQFSLAKLISYPPTPPGECGVNAHHDAGFLTVLLQHGVGGLQAQAPDGSWIDVPPRRCVRHQPRRDAPGDDRELLRRHDPPGGGARAAVLLGVLPRTGPANAARPAATRPGLAAAVAASPRHRAAGFMAKRDDLLAGRNGTTGSGAGVFGQQLWNYYVRSYPENVAQHHPDALRA